MVVAVRVKGGGLASPPQRVVVKAAEVEALRDAAQVAAAAARSARARARLAQRAFVAEKKRGYEEGRAEAEADMAERVFRAAAGSVRYMAGVEERLTGVVMDVLYKVIGGFEPRALVRRVVAKALEAARGQQRVTLRVAPLEAAFVRGDVKELAASAGLSFVDVVADPKVKAGGCVLESEAGVVNAGLETQLAALRRALSRAFKDNRQGAD